MSRTWASSARIPARVLLESLSLNEFQRITQFVGLLLDCEHEKKKKKNRPTVNRKGLPYCGGHENALPRPRHVFLNPAATRAGSIRRTEQKTLHTRIGSLHSRAMQHSRVRASIEQDAQEKKKRKRKHKSTPSRWQKIIPERGPVHSRFSPSGTRDACEALFPRPEYCLLQASQIAFGIFVS